ncbi:MAG: InlB B-repeat-containing protein, partial [Clostridia bacterium]|nr:InlB B-repeat-containing protein [Clostridia bacterium]
AAVASIDYTIESADITLADTTKTGYTFAGWKNDNNEIVTVIVAGSYGDVALTAAWDIITYNVTLDEVGGSEVADFTYTIESETIAIAESAKTGYTFAGWFDADGNEVTEIAAGSYGDVALTAKWDIITYTVTFDEADGVAVADMTYTIETATFALPTTTKTGYTFAGWYNAEGEAVAEIALGSYGDVALTAKWDIVTYNVTLDEVGGSEVADFTYTIESAAIVIEESTKTGYTFAGWFDADGNKVTEIAAGSYGDVALTAKWDIVTYTITFDAVGGDAVASIDYTIESDDITLVATTKTGYTFDGWKNDNNEIVTVIVKGSTGNVALTAMWKANTYSILFYTVKGDADAFAEFEVTYDAAYDITVADANPVNGMSFVGWVDENDNAPVLSGVYTTAGDTVYYAEFELGVYMDGKVEYTYNAAEDAFYLTGGKNISEPVIVLETITVNGVTYDVKGIEDGALADSSNTFTEISINDSNIELGNGITNENVVLVHINGAPVDYGDNVFAKTPALQIHVTQIISGSNETTFWFGMEWRNTWSEYASSIIVPALGSTFDVEIQVDGQDYYIAYNHNGDKKLYLHGSDADFAKFGMVENTSDVYGYTEICTVDFTVASIVAKGYSVYILSTDGNVYVFGDNSKGQLGIASSEATIMAANITKVNALSNIAAVYAGNGYAYFLTTDGSLYGAGSNEDGQMAGLAEASYNAPVLLLQSNVNLVVVSVTITTNSNGDARVLVKTENGAEYRWGAWSV